MNDQRDPGDESVADMDGKGQPEETAGEQTHTFSQRAYVFTEFELNAIARAYMFLLGVAHGAEKQVPTDVAQAFARIDTIVKGG